MTIKNIKIGIDATFTPHGGSLVHLEKFISELSLKYPKENIIIFTKKKNLKIINTSILNLCIVNIVKIASLGNFFRVLWSQIILPFSAKYKSLDVLFCPGNFSPILKTTKIKAQWIANIGPFCEDMYTGESLYNKILFLISKYLILFSGRTSDMIIHQAEYSLNLFKKKYGFNSEKQFLIQCGKNNNFFPNIKTITSNNSISQISTTDFLCVSHLYPYKNIERLILAFASIINQSDINYKLYIVGKFMRYKYYLILKGLVKKLNLEKKIIFTGMVSQEELRYAYSKCNLFIFPSLCESSGYTLIEAMSCGAAILASNRTAIPFTCKNAAEYFDPNDEDDLSSKINIIINDKSKIVKMKKNSLNRSYEMIDYKEAVNIFLNIINSKL